MLKKYAKSVLGEVFAMTLITFTAINGQQHVATDYKTLHFEAIPTKGVALSAEDLMNTLVKRTQLAATSDLSTLNLTYDEAQMLMKIAQAEATTESVEGKAAVMMVVLNRVSDPAFPDTIEGVIFQEHQFSPIADGRYYNAEPDTDCHLALAEVEKGTYDYIEALYFENADQSWQSMNCQYLYTIGHHRFYK